jgi:Outer membrane protein beta-barrel domain
MLAAALGLALLATLATLASAPPAWARKGDSRAGLYVGTTTFVVGDTTTSGVDFGGSYGWEFEDNLLWTLGGSFASVAGDSGGVPLNAKTAAFETGLLAFFNRTPSSTVVWFMGGGLSVMNYDFEFPGTTIGTTSGTAPGAYAMFGAEIRLSREITFIPHFAVQVHSIETQSGATQGLLSGGLVFALRISS